MKNFKFISVLILFTIHCSLFTASAQSWQELMDSTNVYMEKQDFESALLWAEKALPHAEKEFGKDTNYALTLGFIGDIYFKTDKFDSAISYCEKQLQIYMNIFKTDNDNIASCLYNLGDYLYNYQDFDKADSMYKKGLEIRKKIYTLPNPILAKSIYKIAVFLEACGRYQEAESYYKENLIMNNEIYKDDHPNLAKAKGNTAFFFMKTGRYREAEQLLIESVNIFRRLYNHDNQDLSLSINNLASYYDRIGKLEEAEILFKESLEINRRLNNNIIFLLMSITNYADILNSLGRYEEVELLCKEFLQIYNDSLIKDSWILAISINTIADFYNKFGYLQEAGKLYRESMEMSKRFYRNDHPNLALSIQDLAIFYGERNHNQEAESLFNDAINMYKRILINADPDLATCIYHYASFFDNLNCSKKADNLYLEALSIYYKFHSYNSQSLSEEERKLFWSTISDKYERFLSFVIKSSIVNPKILLSAFNNQLFTKGLLINSTQKIKNSILNCGNGDIIRKFEEWQFERDKIAKLYKLFQLQLKEKNINLDSVIISANKKEKELSLISEGFSDTYQKKQIKMKDVQRKLNSDEAAIEIVRFRYYDKKWTDTIYYAALIAKINSKYPELILLKNGNDLESKYINNYKRSILNKLEDKDSYTQFWEPIAKKLKGIKRVYISPDGVYNQINLATLMNPKTEHYLSDDLDIRVVTSTRDLVERKEIPLNPPLSKGEMVVELFGDPMFNLDSTKHLELANAIAENRTREFYYLGNTLDSTTRGGIIPLPSTRTEIEQIANEFTKKGWKVNSHLGEKALEEAVKGVDNPKVLHIATHGKFLKDIEVKDEDRMMGMETKRVAENPLLRSFLLFSGAENTLNDQKLDNQNTDDGLLTAYEAMNLNLDKTDLVVLSACETGLGEIKNGEGVYGLQRAFQQAGAKSIIMSLWTVPDKETQELMTNFYSKWLNGKDKRTAFNEARNEMKDKYHYPYYWGGFVMIGE